jgi:hypothetical protein
MANSQSTSQLGLVIPGVNCPDNQPGGPLALVTAALQTIDTHFGAEEIDAASAAISISSGVVFITKAGVAAMTLAAPASGLPAAGGGDANELTIVSTTANAHTITTPANAINGASHVLTFAAAAGTQVILRAKGGVWYVEPSAPGITIS